MESKKINQLATELAPELSDLTIIGDPTTGISKKITLSQMASLFTGTVEEYPNLASFPLVGTADTIYIALNTNIIYRWNTGTSAYVELSPNIVTSLVFNDANGFDGTISLVGSTATLTITTALTTGSVPFIGASGALTQDNANLFFDNTNNRLGINTNVPTTALDAFGSGIIGRLNGTSTNNSFLGFASNGTNRWSIGNVQSDNRFRIFNEATTSELVSVLSTGEFGIGIANPTTKFHIDGAASALIANLDANVSVAKSISFRSDNSARINLEVSGTESGSNAGADFFIRRYSDAGALIDTPLTITRSTGNISTSASLGVGSSSLTGYNLRVLKTITGATTAYGIGSEGAIQSGVTVAGAYFATSASTQATTFTLTSLYHYIANQGSFGAGSTVTNQYGFFVNNTLTGATNDYGFYGNLAAATNVWNLYMNGTANNYMAGNLGIGSTALTTTSLRVSKNITGATISFGIVNDGVVQSGVTSSAVYNQTSASTAAAAFTLTNIYHNYANQSTFGAGSTVTNQFGYYVESNLIGATNNYAFYGNIPAATGDWNLYMNGTATNYLAGKLLIGSTTDTGATLQVTGTGRFTGDVELNGSSGTRTFTIQSNTSGDAVLKLTAAGVNEGVFTYSRATSELIIGSGGTASAVKIGTTGNTIFSNFVGINGSPATSFPLEAYINSSTAHSSTSRGNVMRVYNSNTGSNIYAGIELGGAGTANDGLAGINAVVTGSGSASLNLYTRDGGTFGEKVRIDSNGQLNMSPYHTNAKFCPGADSNHYLRYLTSLDGLELSGYQGVMFSTLGGSERMRIGSGGEVKITGAGSTNTAFSIYDGTDRRVFCIPSQYYGYIFAVSVASNGGKAISIGNAGGASEVGSIVANASSTTYNTTSDYRLKEDLKDFDGLDILSKIKFYDFKWKSENARTTGVIAHELQEVVPYAVNGEKDGIGVEGDPSYQGVDYSKLVAIQGRAIQQLEARIKQLESK